MLRSFEAGAEPATAWMELLKIISFTPQSSAAWKMFMFVCTFELNTDCGFFGFGDASWWPKWISTSMFLAQPVAGLAV